MEQGAEIVSFHECSITRLHVPPDTSTATSSPRWPSPCPTGPRCAALIAIAREFGVVVMAGLIEAAPAGTFYKCYVAVGPDGFIARHHKLHTFISPFLTPGRRVHASSTCSGVKVGFLICYDNNLPENVRITALMGAEVIIMPHVTGCLPSPMPGRGTVDRGALGEPRPRPGAAPPGVPGAQGARLADALAAGAGLGERRLRRLQQPDRPSTTTRSSPAWR